jgi:hypothetical protein
MKPGRLGHALDMLVQVADLSGRGDKPALPFIYQYHTSSGERLGSLPVGGSLVASRSLPADVR